MNRRTRTVCFGIVALAGGAVLLGLLVAWSYASKAIPAVSITFDGYLVDDGGKSLFTVSNASPFSVVVSGRVYVQIPTNGGWFIQRTSVTTSGWVLRPGQSEYITLPLPSIDEDEWRAEFEAFAHGHYGAPEFLQKAAYNVAIETGLPALRPKRYLILSEPVTNSLSEVSERLRKLREKNKSEKHGVSTE